MVDSYQAWSRDNADKKLSNRWNRFIDARCTDKGSDLLF